MTLPTGIYGDVPFADYLADPCESPSLTSSIAKTLLDRSPMHAYHEHPRLGGGGREKPTRAQDTGTIIHAMVLGGGQEYISCPFDDWRTNAAKAMRDEARDAGLIPVLAKHLDACAEVARRLDDTIPGNTQREVTAVWLSDGVLCRGRIDAVAPGDGLILDLKTCEDAARTADGRSVISFGRDMEAASRLDSLETLLPEMAGRWRFVYVFAEIEPPYAVVQAELSRELLELGRRKWRRAVSTWRECMATGIWRGPHGGTTTIEAPAWALTQDMELQLATAGNSNAELGL